MIDAEGYRANVGIIICNQQGQLLWTRRYGQTSWQFPQGGVNPGESAEQTMFRELYEEVGLGKDDVRILGSTQHWYKYRLPARFIRHNQKPLCIGQKQKWFLLQLVSDESTIDFNATNHPEFDEYIWVNYWYPVRNVVNFKRDVYRSALSELMHSMYRFQLGDKRQQQAQGSQQARGNAGHRSQHKKPHSQDKRRRKPRHPYRAHAQREQGNKNN